MTRPRLLFVSPRYLLPADMGGKIRTTHVLKGMHGGHFHVTLATPAPRDFPASHRAELNQLCDRMLTWPERGRGPLFAYTRARHLASDLPIPVATDCSRVARRVIAEAARDADVIVADFLHSAVLVPPSVGLPSILFTHNVEAEIFARHAQIATGALHKALWRDQLRKMQRFESETLHRFDCIVAVSERDRDHFQRAYGVAASTIPTGVDLDYFAFHPIADNPDPPVIAFTASMDSLANIDGVRWFMDEVWPLIAADLPNAEMRVIGRNPDPALVAEAGGRALKWTFTGYVEDVRPWLEGSAVYVIPLRVGGGTRIKAYEAMAFGLPVVSTRIGVEGLAVAPGRHFLEADTAQDFAAAVLAAAKDATLRRKLAQEARGLVEQNFSARSVGRAFEEICLRTFEARRGISASLGRTPVRGTSEA